MVAVEEGTQQTLLHAAISSGSVSAFEGVLDAVRGHLARHEVRQGFTYAPVPSLQHIWTVQAKEGACSSML